MYIIAITFLLGSFMFNGHSVATYSTICENTLCVHTILLESTKDPRVIRFRVQSRDKMPGNYEIDEWRI